ncbi:teichoic acid transport system ATP-binding protein [Haloechinothrix alba]|uniref:Teichoic acid transport system ATP-binding protein n=1 Tax=Haloechinothrix alba TaxID=664784 RepID=A0A238UXQ4_9PSEU|nr:ABC transporter ATP-binding protein [Haloechinothrix alba]SNR26965.1 teichoic acid transport system ATP-binding protein [Haloechinothrix alba]
MAELSETEATPATGQPTVIVDDLHVVYRVIGAANGQDKGNSANALKRLLLRQQRPSVKEVHAIRGISFTAYEGDAIGVVGRNGSGKSTLMRAIAGLLPASQGAVYALGQPSFLGVNAALMSGLSGERNVELGCLAMGMSREEARERHDDIVEFSGLDESIKMPMRTYSTGMGARLRFAIAAAKSHDVLIVDEALATGDRDFRQKSEKRIQELRKEAGTVFLVSHSMKQITRTCNRAIWVDEGVIRMDGEAESVVQAYLDENS